MQLLYAYEIAPSKRALVPRLTTLPSQAEVVLGCLGVQVRAKGC